MSDVAEPAVEAETAPVVETPEAVAEPAPASAVIDDILVRLAIAERRITALIGGSGIP